MFYYAVIEDGTGICFNVEQSETAISNPNYIQIDSLDQSYLYRKKYVNGAWVNTTIEEAQQFNGHHIGIFGKWLDEALIDIQEGAAPVDHTHTGYAAASHEHTGYAAASHTHTGYAAASHTHDYAASNHTHSGYAASSHTHNYAASDHTHTPASIGAAAASHTHSYAASNHTHTPASIGAAATSHTHSYLPLTGGTVTGETNFSGGLVRLKGVQTLYHSGTQLIFGSNNLPTRIGGSAITATKTIQVDSDERLKENVVPVDAEACCKLIADIDVKTFNYIGNDEDCMGVIAQEMENNDLAKFFVSTGPDGYLAVKEAGMVWPAIVALQKAFEHIWVLEAKVAALEAHKCNCK